MDDKERYERGMAKRRKVLGNTMLALDKWEEFRMHVRAALTEGGFTADDIKEIILQQAIYCGVPAANHAFKEAAEVIDEIAKSKYPKTRFHLPRQFGLQRLQ